MAECPTVQAVIAQDPVAIPASLIGEGKKKYRTPLLIEPQLRPLSHWIRYCNPWFILVEKLSILSHTTDLFYIALRLSADCQE